MITEAFCLLNNNYQYKSATQQKLNSYFLAWVKKIITVFFITMICINVFDKNDSYDILLSDTNSNSIKQLTNTKGYDAEGTLSIDRSKMIFTSMRNGDLDLYVMDLKTYNVKQITNTLGYDGGAWFSSSDKKIVW